MLYKGDITKTICKSQAIPQSTLLALGGVSNQESSVIVTFPVTTLHEELKKTPQERRRGRLAPAPSGNEG